VYRSNSFAPFRSALSAYTTPNANGTYGTYSDLKSAADGASSGATSLQGRLNSTGPVADINTTQVVGHQAAIL
jgi:hypothetical protein